MKKGGGQKMTLGTFIRNCRIRLGYTLDEVSLKTGISITSLSAIENDKKKPRFSNMKKLADVLKINSTEIFEKYYL